MAVDLSEEPEPISSLVRDSLALVPRRRERFPHTRTGQREPISPTVRFLVHCRDDWRCAWCNFISSPHQQRTDQWLEADHIYPWSDGGNDDCSNLRSLCNKCNAERSNYLTAEHPYARSCAVWCEPCKRLLDRAGIDTSTYWSVEPWNLRKFIPRRSQLVGEYGGFDLEPPPQRTSVFCFWGSHISWTSIDWDVL